jgi:hypothetical protein
MRHSPATTTPSTSTAAASAVKASSTASGTPASAITSPTSVTELLGLSARRVASEGIIATTCDPMTVIAIAAHRIVPWIERWLVVEGVAASGRRRIVERVPAKLSRPVRRRIAVLESGKLLGVWKGWFFDVPGVGQLSRSGGVVWSGARVVEGTVAASIRCGVTGGRVWWASSARVRWTNSAGISRSVTASIACRYGAGIGNVNVAIVSDVASAPIAAPIVVIVVDERADQQSGPE